MRATLRIQRVASSLAGRHATTPRWFLYKGGIEWVMERRGGEVGEVQARAEHYYGRLTRSGEGYVYL